MKTVIKCCLLLGLSCLFFKAAYSQKGVADKQFSSGDLTFLDMLGDTVSYEKDIHQKPLLLIYFRPDCEDCQYLSRLLKAHASSYPLTIWMVSAASLDQLQTFETMMDLFNIDNLKVLQDNTASMHKWFDFKWLPFLVLLDENGKVIKTFEGLPAPKVITDLL